MTAPDTRPGPTDGPAFLLAQLGAHAANRFAERLSQHNLTPALVGILRLLRTTTGNSQQALAARLGMPPSRLVPLVDDLEERGLVRRERSRTDRRVNTLQLTPDGQAVLQTIGPVAQAHQASLLASLSNEERATLTTLLTRIADEQGLAAGVHPGYRTLGSDTAPATVKRQTAHDGAPSPTSASL